ncbi:hypothetical protein RchiOBHm_Chr3g0497501 [Rosa chinensis]|uniref:Uncharacterized protein n=1 Tax=Rosa chinensis TaxID=74649 RepID=A0A2P6RHS6_ROSCH|nr:hypothetical protein RchiOBHm_Chr3g0497501 [Rosa chinensis]
MSKRSDYFSCSGLFDEHNPSRNDYLVEVSNAIACRMHILYIIRVLKSLEEE